MSAVQVSDKIDKISNPLQPAQPTHAASLAVMRTAVDAGYGRPM